MSGKNVGVPKAFQKKPRPRASRPWGWFDGYKIYLCRKTGLHFGTGSWIWEAELDDGGVRDHIYGRAFYVGDERRFICCEKSDIVPQHQAGAFRTWRAMRLRCCNPNHPQYADYGGRGIEVYSAWLPSAYDPTVKPTSNALEPCRKAFGYFFADLGVRPDGTSLERINVNGHYEPGNVEWIEEHAQAFNKRRYRR